MNTSLSFSEMLFLGPCNSKPPILDNVFYSPLPSHMVLLGKNHSGSEMIIFL